MNIYDMKQIHCYRCGKFIGEIEFDAEITMPLCGKCSNPMPENDDKIRYVITKYGKSSDTIPA
ncbi:hypothetical protein [Candidatus Nitrosotenuis uzonensis]|uniref:Uncharacterized protein n=1 Tax=Candidatus Nitrosotenuis uzonensis TaxID=1407055 RepID=A0A812F4G8_9ARCH|nr:hypothetical protein [Candidatus Nitrosotenuis uzonensis]MCA2003665.1 hypothetical protein [Candidatus Nitrosotenuis sp.]CAE6504594.1 conserved hypothetical protein [Candidatus Nitrosotenuis uzonensis]